MNHQPFPILEIKDILCGIEPMPQNNEVYYSSYAEHYLNKKFRYKRSLTWPLTASVVIQPR